MSIALDIIIMATLVIFAARHYKLGLICSVFNAGKFLLAILIACLLSRPTAELIKPMLYGAVSDSLLGMLSSIIAFIAVFVIVIIASSVAIFFISKIKIPIITSFDKLLGLVLGLCLGIFAISLISTVAYSIIEFISNLKQDAEIMNIYNDSYVFRFVYDLKIFEFIRKLI